jgi:hypothetical protein
MLAQFHCAGTNGSQVALAKMNTLVLQMKNRLPRRVRSALVVNYYRALNFFPGVLAICRSTVLLASHLSADIVPGFYWRQAKRALDARRS